MCRPTWPFLLLYESYNLRHTGFPQVDDGQQDSRKLGSHKFTNSGPKGHNLISSYSKVGICIS